MGVDLYAGPLARYYALDWETPAAAFARRNNLALETLHAKPPVKLAGAEGRTAVRAFRDRVEDKLGVLPSWQLDPAAPYEAHQLTREGLNALVLAAAHRHRPEMTLPFMLPDDVQAHPSVAEASERNYYIGPMAVFEAQIIVPGGDGRICGDTDCRGNPAIVVTTVALAGAIEDMMEFLGTTRDDLVTILAEGPPPVHPQVMEMRSGEWVTKPVGLREYQVLAHALWGLACFNACLSFAEKTGSAIVRDE